MKIQLKRILTIVLTVALVVSLLTMQVLADGTVTPVTGISVKASTATSGPTLSDGTITITRKGGLFNSSTCTITITNSGSVAANVSFSYVHSGSGSATLNGTTITSTSGTCSKSLDAGGTVSMTLLGAGGYATGTLTLSKFSWTEISADAKATVTYDSTKGSVSLGGSVVASGGSATPTNGTLAAVATPVSGYRFLGWINADTNEILNDEATATLDVPQDMNVQAVFVKSDGSDTAWFLTGNYMYDDLNDAVSVAGTDGVVLPVYDGTLPAGNYTIPSGVTLLIPCDSSHTVYTTTPNQTEPTSFGATPPAVTSFRKLTMATGANITVNGAVSLGGTQWAGGLYISATGASGFIHMNSGSTITINNGGALYAWGYITGSGSVTAKSGASVYEQFQVGGWRGGDMTSTMVNSNTNGVFPMSQYYVQNIEVPLTLESGAVETAFASARITIIGIQPISVDFVGASDSMFKITSGYVVKDYVEDEDRLNFEIHGDVSLTPITINMTLGLLGSIDMATADFELPMNNNMTIHAVSGNMAIDQDVALLPGTQVVIDEGVTCTLGSGVSLYAYDVDEWGTYCGSVDKTFIAIPHAPGRTYTRTAADLVDASICVNGTIDATKGYLYTTESKANVYSTDAGVVKTQAGTQTVTYQLTQTDETYHEIPITPAQLKNGDGSYVDTSVASEVLTYTYENGFWNSNAVATIVSQGKDYASLQSAVDAFASNDSYIQMLADTTESTYTINKAVTIDLNKFKVEVGGASATVTCIDSGTNAFASVPGTNLGSINVEADAPTKAVNGKYYIAITGDGVTTFHRVAVGVTCCQFIYDKPNNKQYIVVQGTFKGTDQSVAKLTDLGFKFTDTGATTAGTADFVDPSDTSYHGVTWSYYFGRDFDSSVTGTVTVQALMEFGQGATPFMSNPTEDLVALYKEFLNRI